MLTHTTKILTMGAIICAASFAAVPASAGLTTTVSVKIDSSDLLSEAGTKRVYRQLKKKAEAACGVNHGYVSLQQKVAANKCKTRLMNEFVPQLNSRRMTALHQGNKAFTG